MQKWQFGQNRDRRWYWRRVNDDATYEESSGTFTSRLDCVADAFEHGYLAPETGQTIFLTHRELDHRDTQRSRSEHTR